MRDYARYCLLKWAEWVNDTNGYPERSNIARFQEIPAHRAESSLPSGIEPRNRETEIAIRILNMMLQSSAKSKKNADILKQVNANREQSETIEETIGRIGIKCSNWSYSEALGEFTIRLETILFES